VISVLITGGTGAFGMACAKHLLCTIDRKKMRRWPGRNSRNPKIASRTCCGSVNLAA